MLFSHNFVPHCMERRLICIIIYKFHANFGLHQLGGSVLIAQSFGEVICEILLAPTKLPRMLSCFPCGRSDRSVLEPTTSATSKAQKVSPSFEETDEIMNKDQLLSALSCPLTELGAKTCLNKMGSLTVATDAKDMDLFSFSPQTQMPLMSAIAADTTVIGDGHTQDEYSTEEGNHITSPIKGIICSKQLERKKDVLVSSILAMQKDGSIQDNGLAHVDAGHEAEKSDKLSAKQDICLIRAIPEEGTTRIMHVEWEADAYEGPKAEKDATFYEYTQAAPQYEDDIGYYGKGDISQRRKPSVLFSYGISDQQRDFMFLCAGLVIQAVGFQLKSMVEVITMLILLGYRMYLFVSGLAHSLGRAKKNLADMHTTLLSRVSTENIRLDFPILEKWEAMKPWLIAGAKKLGWGCLNAAYVIAMLSALLFISFLFSYFAVLKRSSTQKPIHVTRELYFDYTKSHPVASLDLYSFDAYIRMTNASKGSKVPAAATISLRFRSTFLLTLPESDFNRKLGVFQVTSELLSESGEILVKASQPCMLHFKSNTVQYVKSICMAIPLLTGVASETQTLSLHLLDWQQGASSPSASELRIMLVPRAGRAVSTGLPELYKAEVQLDSLHGPWMTSSSSSIKTLVMWLWLSFLVFGCLSSFCMYKMHHSS